MKRVHPDLGQKTVNNYVGCAGRNRKFKRFWGTEFIDGVEVIKGRAYYHPTGSLPVEHERLFRFLDVWDQLEDADHEGLRNAWFYLNKDNGPETFDVPNTYLVDNLNSMWWDDNDGVRPEDLTLTTTISIGENWSNRDLGTSLIDPNLPKEQQAQAVIDNYESMWATNKITQEGVGVINKGSVHDPVLLVDVPDEDDLSPDDPWLAVVARYALRDNGIPCTIKDVEVGISSSTHRIHNTVVVTIEIPYYEFSPSSPAIQQIVLDTDNATHPRFNYGIGFGYFQDVAQSNEVITQTLIRRQTFNETPEDLDDTVVSRGYTLFGDAQLGVSSYDSLWHKSGNTWYLRAEVFTDPKLYGIGQVDLHNYLFTLLDTGYKKKKAPFWKKLVAIIIFIIAVIVAVVTYGGTSPYVYAAWAIVVAAFVYTLISMALSALGYNEWAMAFSEANQFMSPLVMVASIVLIFSGYVNGTESFGTALGNLAAAEGVKALGEAIGGTAGALVSTVGSAYAGGKVDPNKFAMAILKAYSMTERNKLQELKAKNNDLAAEYDELAEEAARQTDAMKGFMNIYAKPATADWSMYASQFDLPYERGGGNLAVGNIQRTTKKALRPGNYDDPMFENMRLV